MSVIDYRLEDQLAIVRFDDGKANALSHAALAELDAAYHRAEKEARAMLLVGRAGRFSAGFDLQEMMGGADRAGALVTRGAELLLRAYLAPLPVVVACTGHALAAGALLLLTGDYRLGARGSFKIGLNEVQIGLPVPVLAMELARDRIHPMHLTAATLFATVNDPDKALAAGWVDEVVEEAELEGRATAKARRLAELSKDAYAKTKVALRERTVHYVRENLARDLERLMPPG